jgi:hypothetical protein
MAKGFFQNCTRKVSHLFFFLGALSLVLSLDEQRKNKIYTNKSSYSTPNNQNESLTKNKLKNFKK